MSRGLRGRRDKIYTIQNDIQIVYNNSRRKEILKLLIELYIVYIGRMRKLH